MASKQTKQIQDEDGIVYEETDYNTYLKSKGKHRIVKTLEHQYFVQVDGTNDLVIVESPYAGDEHEVTANIQYAKRCVRDCFERGEYPFASHLLYTQDGILNDQEPEERKMGIQAGLKWGSFAIKTVVYTDLGISEGMKKGIDAARKAGRRIIYRELEESDGS